MKVQFIIQTKDVFGHWRDTMAYPSIELARAAWPLWRKGSKREMRCIRREESLVDMFAAPQSTEQPKGESHA